jgi:phage I-like protein
MPDDTTAASTTSEGAAAAPELSTAELKQRAEAAEARAEAHSKDADQAKRYLVDLVSRLGNQGAGESPPPAAAADATPDELIQEFKENPVGLLDRHFAARMGPILHDHLDTQAKMNREASISRNADDWKEFGAEVDAFMAPMSPSTRAKPGSWDEGLRYIKAKHLDEIVEKKMKAKVEAEKKGLVEGRGSSAGGGTNGRAVRLSAIEKEVAKGFGMTEEEWIKNKTPAERGEVDEF